MTNKNCTMKLNIYKVSSSIMEYNSKYPIIIAAKDLQEAYDTFRTEFLDDKYIDSEYFARNIESICKIGEYLAVSEDALDKIKKELN